MDAEYDIDTQAKANPPIPNLLDTLDKQLAILSESVRGLEERLDKVVTPSDTVAASPADGHVPHHRGGSNITTRLAEVSSQVGRLGARLNDLMGRLEL